MLEKPSVLPVKFNNLPQELTALRIWTLGKLEYKADRDAWSKEPYGISGKHSKSNNANTWASFDSARKTYISDNYDLVGIMLKGCEPLKLVVIDIDYYQGEPLFERFFELFKDRTYCELSPSGKFRALCSAEIVKGFNTMKSKGDTKLEIFTYHDAKYATLTGHRLNDLGIVDCQDLIDQLIETYWKQPERQEARLPQSTLSQAEIAERKSKMLQRPSVAKLFNGDMADYSGDHSSADMALCGHLAFWMSGDQAAMDQVFRESKLMRTKWDEKHYSDGSTYGAQLLNKAASESSGFYGSDKPQWQIDYDLHVQDFNQRFASTYVTNKHRIACFKPASIETLDQEMIEFIGRGELSAGYDHTCIRIGGTDDKPKYANHVQAWLKHPKVRNYLDGIVFIPEAKLKDSYLNLWTGFGVVPIQNDALLKPILYHIFEVLCSGNQELFEYNMKWLAYTFQFPAKQAGVALVYRGEKGAGKGTLISGLLSPIWSKHYMQLLSSKQLIGDFNSHLADKCLIFADEAFFAGDKKSEGVLKGIITEPTLNIERKGVDIVQQRNYLKIIMSTNSDHAVPASKDERRYFVSDVSSKHLGDKVYFKELQAHITKDEVRSAFLYAMLAKDLGSWRPSDDIPDSAGLRSQRFLSMKPHQQWLAQELLEGTLSIDNLEWATSCSTRGMYDKFIAYCNEYKISTYDIIGIIGFSKYLSYIYKKHGNVRKVQGLQGYWLGTKEEAIKDFQDYEKVILEELIPQGKGDYVETTLK